MATKASRSNFYFVSPSEPLGTRDAYGGESPARVFERTSWEWIYEQILRRTCVLSAIGADVPSEYLAARKGAYRLSRLVPTSHSPSPSPPIESMLALPGPARLPDGRAKLVEGGGETYVPHVSAETVVRTPAELGGLVSSLASSSVGMSWFVDPDAGSQDGRSTEGSVVATTRYAEARWYPDSHQGGTTTSAHTSTDVRIVPMPPFDPPLFRPVADMRLDDDPETADVPVWDGKEAGYVDVPTSYSLVPSSRKPTYDPDVGEFRKVDCRGRQVRFLRLYGLSAVTDGLGVPCSPRAAGQPTGLSLSYSGSDVGRDGDAYGFFVEGDDGNGNAAWSPLDWPDVGTWPDPPAPERAGIGSAGQPLYGVSSALVPLRLCASPSWDGRPTAWAAWGFPKLGSVGESTVLGRQLSVLCAAQPAPPPWSYQFAGGTPEAPDEDGLRPYSGRDAPERPFPVACPCEPACMAGMLGKLTSTVIEFTGDVCADVAADATEFRSDVTSASFEDGGYHDTTGTRRTEETRKTEIRGTYVGSLKGLLDLVFGGGRDSSDRVERSSTTARRSPTLDYTRVERTVTAKSFAVSSATASRFVLLGRRASVEPTLLVKEKVARSRTYSGGYYAGREDYETSHESARSQYSAFHDDVPEGYGKPAGAVGDGDLFVHPDVLAWARRAELYAVVDVAAVARGSAGCTETYSGRQYSDSHWESATSGSGSKTSLRRVTALKVGDVDLSSGALSGSADLARLFRLSDPGSGFAGAYFDADSSVTSESVDYSGGSGLSATGRREERYPAAQEPDIRSARLYLVVDWDFGTDSPPEPKGSAGCAKDARELAGLEERLRRAESRALALREAAPDARASLESLSAAKDGLESAMSAGASALADEIEEAEADLAGAEAELAGAEAELAGAEAELAGAEASGDPVRIASAKLAVSAAKDLVESREDAVAVRRERLDLLTEEDLASEEDARSALAALGEALSALGEALSALGEAVGALGDLEGGTVFRDAAAALGDARAFLCREGSSGKVAALRGAVEGAEAALEAVDGLEEESLGAESAAGSALRDAERAVWAYLRSA